MFKQNKEGYIMRGSVYYQTSLLTKMVFEDGMKKEERTNKYSENYKGVSSYKTMQSYREVWNNFGKYLRTVDIKNLEETTALQIENYMKLKIEKKLSIKYLKKISSALGKLEVALTRWNQKVPVHSKTYDFSSRQKILDNALKDNELCDGYHERQYYNPLAIINELEPEHQIYAKAQLESGIRVEALIRLKHMVFLGKCVDKTTQKTCYSIETIEKGGKCGKAYLSKSIYYTLKKYKKQARKLCYRLYSQDIRNTCIALNIKPEGSHAFRWNFAINRIREYQLNQFNYDETLVNVSNEMKHNRASISKHYLGFKQS